MCEVNYYILYQDIPMVVKKICKIKIDFTKLSSKTAVIQSLKLLTTKKITNYKAYSDYLLNINS